MLQDISDETMSINCYALQLPTPCMNDWKIILPLALEGDKVEFILVIEHDALFQVLRFTLYIYFPVISVFSALHPKPAPTQLENCVYIYIRVAGNLTHGFLRC